MASRAPRDGHLGRAFSGALNACGTKSRLSARHGTAFIVMGESLRRMDCIYLDYASGTILESEDGSGGMRTFVYATVREQKSDGPVAGKEAVLLDRIERKVIDSPLSVARRKQRIQSAGSIVISVGP